MPELPEVETTVRGLAPRVLGARICRVAVREPRLRWPIAPELADILTGAQVVNLGRRGKYVLLGCDRGTLIVHLGMSGSLRLVREEVAPTVHEHVDLILENGWVVRLRDPRRFGALLWAPEAPKSHPLLARLGPEPLEPGFDAQWLYRRTRGRKATIKQALMDGRLVAGLGNIYANEALFHAGIRPDTPAGRLSRLRCARLVAAIKKTLRLAIRAGGSSLRDYVGSTGELGYFQLKLWVYDRAGMPCRACGTLIRVRRLGQRSSFYCPVCQR
jgi:formamidopyrimidine-DNA glycosylase